jgi:hypothetical protein
MMDRPMKGSEGPSPLDGRDQDAGGCGRAAPRHSPRAATRRI